MVVDCPPQDKLKSLSLGQLPEEQSDVLLRHLETCDSCQEEISQLDQSEDTFVRQIKTAGEIETAENAEQFETEDGCRIAVTRALAALATAESGGGTNEPSLPASIGEYDIVKPLGAGGMGHVYLGQHTKLGRPVAIKFLADHRRWDQTMHERFASEMRLIGGLKHANIVVAHDAREVDGVAVLVTEYIDGMTLSEILKRTGKLKPAEACKIVGEVCKALSYIDSKGLVHRDIKPSNIMIDADGSVKLLDLGLARLQPSSEMEATEFTATGQAMGTADYVAPEQVNDARSVDIRADIYGLGCTLYKLLSGQAPFAGKHSTAFAKMNAHLSEQPESLDDKELPKGLVALVDEMLEKKADSRPQSPADVLARVEKHARSADLNGLLAKARTMPELKAAKQVGVAETSVAPKPKTESSFFNKHPLLTAMAGGLAAFAFGLWLGVVITVKKPDGTTAQVEIPAGSKAIVDEQGNIEIVLAGSDQKLSIPKEQVDIRRRQKVSDDRLVAKSAPQEKRGSSESQNQIYQQTRSGLKAGWESAPQEKRVSGESQNQIYQQTSSGLKAGWVYVGRDSPIFGKVDEGDLVDVILTQPNSGGGESIIETLCSGRVHRVIPKEEGFLVTIGTPIKVPDNVAQRSKIIVDFMNRNRFTESKLNGVWRAVLSKVDGKVVDSDHALLIHNGNFISFVGDNVTPLSFKLSPQYGNRRIDFDDGYQPYRFLESGRLELGERRDRRRDKKSSGFSSNSMTRFERVTTPRSKEEKAAFETLELSKKVESKFECYLAEDWDPGFEIPLGSKLVPFDGKHLLLVGNPVITNESVASATLSYDEKKRSSLVLELTAEGAARMKLASHAHLKKKMSMLIDGEVVMAPIVQSVISKSVTVTGDFDAKELARLSESIIPNLKFPARYKDDENRMRSKNNLQELMLAVHNYESANRMLPVEENRRNKKDPPHSWRVAILPYIGQQALHDQYDFKQPWDSEVNKKVLDQMPDVFRHPSISVKTNTTNYVGIAGDVPAEYQLAFTQKMADANDPSGMDEYGADFGDGYGDDYGDSEDDTPTDPLQLRTPHSKSCSLVEIIDGTSNVVFLIESKAGIPWTKPEDFSIEAWFKSGKLDFNAIKQFEFLDEAGLGCVAADGKPYVLDRKKIIPKDKADLDKNGSLLLKLFLINDRAVVDLDSLKLDE